MILWGRILAPYLKGLTLAEEHLSLIIRQVRVRAYVEETGSRECIDAAKSGDCVLSGIDQVKYISVCLPAYLSRQAKSRVHVPADYDGQDA